MSSIRTILVEQGPDRVDALLQACPRKVREELFRHLGLKPRTAKGFKLSSAKDERAARFFEVISSDREIRDEVFVELVRCYLFTKRELLADALDVLDVPHKDGLTDSDLEFMKELPAEQVEMLQRALHQAGHAAEDIGLYTDFMGIPRST